MSPANPDTVTAAPLSPSVVERRQVRLSMVMAAFVVLVGAGAAVAARDLAYWTSLGPGPGFFPLWLGVLLCVFGLIWFAQLVRRQRRGPAATPGIPDSEVAADSVLVDETPPEFSLPTVVAIVVSLCVLAAVLEVLGYQLSMFLFLMFHLMVLGRRRLLLSLVIALAGSIGVFVAFTRVLTVPLPASSIPFLQSLGL